MPLVPIYHCEKCEMSSLTDPPSIGVCRQLVCDVHGKTWHWPEEWRAIFMDGSVRSPLRICALCLEDIPREEYGQHLASHGYETLAVRAMAYVSGE